MIKKIFSSSSTENDTDSASQFVSCTYNSKFKKWEVISILKDETLPDKYESISKLES